MIKVLLLVLSVGVSAFAAKEDPRFTYDAAAAQFASARVPAANDVVGGTWTLLGTAQLDSDDEGWYSPDGRNKEDDGFTYWSQVVYSVMTDAFGQNPALMQGETDYVTDGAKTNTATPAPRAVAVTSEGLVSTNKGSHGPCETKYHGDGSKTETCQNTCANKLIDRLVSPDMILRAQQFTDPRDACSVFNRKKPQRFLLLKKI